MIVYCGVYIFMLVPKWLKLNRIETIFTSSVKERRSRGSDMANLDKPLPGDPADPETPRVPSLDKALKLPSGIPDLPGPEKVLPLMRLAYALDWKAEKGEVPPLTLTGVAAP